MCDLSACRLGILSVGALIVVFLSYAVASTAARAESFSVAETKNFVERMHIRHSFDPIEVQTILGKAQVLDSVLQAISRPAEGKAWYEYRQIFLQPLRIERGADFMAEHLETLMRAEKEFGVSPEIIVAIIGVETLFGEHKGRHRVLDALATLGFRYPRRSEFFATELEHFLLLSREEGLDPLEMTGSYAGAMGIPQFISSSYRSYAVDFDGDSVRNLFGSVEDAIGSVANYLKRHGWRHGEVVTLPVSVKGEGYAGLLDLGLKPNTTLTELQKHGVMIYAAVDGSKKGTLLEFELQHGVEHWVGLNNFYSITRYNHSALYAMAVFQLSQAILESYQSSS